MKKCKIPVFQLCVLLMWPVSVWASDPGVPKWYGNDHYKITRSSNLVKIKMDKQPWESFSVAWKELAAGEGFLSLQLKVSEQVDLRIDGFTAEKKQIPLLQENIAPGDFRQLSYELSATREKLDYLVFYVNPGKAYKGEVLIKDLQVKARQPGANAFVVYPNPASNVVHVTLPHQDFRLIQVYDVLGKLVMSQPAQDAFVKVNLSGVPAGVYVIKAKGDQGVLSARVVVR